jgi:hypothetical protein
MAPNDPKKDDPQTGSSGATPGTPVQGDDAGDDGSISGGQVPIEQWIQHPVSDWADYLDSPAVRGTPLSPEAQAQLDASYQERLKAEAGHEPRRGKRQPPEQQTPPPPGQTTPGKPPEE